MNGKRIGYRTLIYHCLMALFFMWTSTLGEYDWLSRFLFVMSIILAIMAILDAIVITQHGIIEDLKRKRDEIQRKIDEQNEEE